MERISLATAKELWRASGNECAYPGCVQRLSDDKWPAVLGEVVFIDSGRAGRPRFNASATPSDLVHFSNLLLLCPNHHYEIDVLESDRWTTARLLALKRDHESSAAGLHWASDDRVAEVGRLFLKTHAVLAVSTYLSARHKESDQ